MTNTPEQPYNPPVVENPETGMPEIIGQGRIAVLGKQGVERLVTLPETDDLIDKLVADGELTYGA